MRRGLCVLTLGALTTATPALGASGPTVDAPRLTSAAATAHFLAVPKVRHWLDRYPADPRTEADFDKMVHDAHFGSLSVRDVWGGVITSFAWHAGQIALTNRLMS